MYLQKIIIVCLQTIHFDLLWPIYFLAIEKMKTKIIYLPLMVRIDLECKPFGLGFLLLLLRYL